MTTHYDVLGVSPSATRDELRRAYLRRAKDHHPDRQVVEGVVPASDAARLMQDLNAAWEVLGNPDARTLYDASLGLDRSVEDHRNDNDRDASSPLTDPAHSPDPAGASSSSRVFAGEAAATAWAASATAEGEIDDHLQYCDCGDVDGCGYVHSQWDVINGHDRLPPTLERVDRDPNGIGLRIGIALIGVVLVAALTALVVAGLEGRGSSGGTSVDGVTSQAVGSGAVPAVGVGSIPTVGSCVVLAIVDARVALLAANCSTPSSLVVIEAIPLGRPCSSGAEAVDISADGLRLCLVQSTTPS